MRKKDVKLGLIYIAKVSGKKVPVKITSKCEFGGWYAMNMKTGRPVRIKTGGRLISC